MVGGLIRKIKIPVQELRIKTLRRLICEGGLLCGTLRYNFNFKLISRHGLELPLVQS